MNISALLFCITYIDMMRSAPLNSFKIAEISKNIPVNILNGIRSTRSSYKTLRGTSLNQLNRKSREVNFPIYENVFNNYHNYNNINYFNQAFSDFEKQYGTSTLSPDDKWQNDTTMDWSVFLNSMNSSNYLKNVKYQNKIQSKKVKNGSRVDSIEKLKKNYYSKSFNPYADYPDIDHPVTPQNAWYSRYYDLTVQVQAIPYSEHQRLKKNNIS